VNLSVKGGGEVNIYQGGKDPHPHLQKVKQDDNRIFRKRPGPRRLGEREGEEYSLKNEGE